MNAASINQGMSRVASVEEIILAKLEDKFGNKAELTDALAFIGVDSVGMAELTVDLEKEFNVIVDDDIVTCETVQELADYIKERRSSSAPNQ